MHRRLYAAKHLAAAKPQITAAAKRSRMTICGVCGEAGPCGCACFNQDISFVTTRPIILKVTGEFLIYGKRRQPQKKECTQALTIANNSQLHPHAIDNA
jgi:hypothetical protein